ncbi:hypothetical protein KDW_17530 [Dictyobacter vulcani]|uniref:Uncharacterized protein n=1 Tax=Dictyobacter vulcani TaxID=2607529 RepID=A0A5J4KMS5_9CHLR|nr:hypothetical protein [Dictyobacter vulcani]GER87591.1 hypothetical protein KDW_17530 [Dictyobacter vulcani]
MSLSEYEKSLIPPPPTPKYTDTQEFADLARQNPAAAFSNGVSQTIKERRKEASADTSQTEPLVKQQGQSNGHQTIPNTPPPLPKQGIFDGLKTWWQRGGNGSSSNSQGTTQTAAPPKKEKEAPPPDERSAIEKMRDKVAEFDEDYKDIGERLLGGFTQFIGYAVLFLLMAWIGSDLGKFFTPTMDLVPAYGLAFTIEGVIAACTVAMGRAFAELSSGKPNFGRMAMVVLIWIILNSSSAFGLYLVITHNNQITQGSIEQLSMVIRVIAVALADLGCSAVLMFKGRSLQKHIESIRKRATAIGELADAQRGIEEADKNAALRDQMMKSTLKIQEDLSEKIGEAVSMVMTSILEKMEKALKDEEKNERGYGRR